MTPTTPILYSRTWRGWRLFFIPQGIPPLDPARAKIVAVHPRNYFELDFLGTHGFAFSDIRAASEQFLLHLHDEVQHALIAFGLALGKQAQVGNFCAGEQSGSRVGASRYACAASNAGGCVHREIGVSLRNRNGISVRRVSSWNGNESTAGNDAIERASIDNQIFDYRKRTGSPRLEIKDVAVLEVAHVELANGGSSLRPMSYTVDHESTRAADAFAAIVVKSDRVFTFRNELFVEHVQHFQEGHVPIDLVVFVQDHAAHMVRVLLPPYVESEFHHL